jgi:hypothetical protein
VARDECTTRHLPLVLMLSVPVMAPSIDTQPLSDYATKGTTGQPTETTSLAGRGSCRQQWVDTAGPHMISQHQFPGVRMEVDLLVHSPGWGTVVHVVHYEQQRHNQRWWAVQTVLGNARQSGPGIVETRVHVAPALLFPGRRRRGYPAPQDPAPCSRIPGTPKLAGPPLRSVFVYRDDRNR